MSFKLANRANNESSESDLSQSEDQSHHRITMLNHQRKQYLKEKNVQQELESNDSDISSESSSDQNYTHNVANSNSNPKFSQTNFQITRGGRQINIQNQNQEISDDQDSLQNHQINPSGPQYSDSQQEQSEEEDQFNKYPLGNGIQTVREDSQEDSDESIDHIEQRIKKLEKDLQTRLGKQSNKKQEKPKNNKAGIFSNKSHPPIPQPQLKVGSIAPSKKRIQSQNKTPNIQRKNNDCQNKMNILNRNIQVNKVALPVSTLDKKIKKNESNTDIHKKNINEKKKGKKIHKSTNPESNTEIEANPKKVKKHESKPVENIVSTNSIQVESLKQEMRKMNEEMTKLNIQNNNLKKQLQEVHKKESVPTQKSKKKPLQELEKLQQISKASQNSKLQKEIQLLQVIQKLQNKLKKSINKKLLNHKGSSSATLLHKGLPASLLANS